MDNCGSLDFASPSRAGGGLYPGFTSAMLGLVRRNEDLDVHEGDRLKKDEDKAVTGVVSCTAANV